MCHCQVKAHLCVQEDGNAASVKFVVLSDFLDDFTVRLVVAMRHVQPVQGVATSAWPTAAPLHRSTAAPLHLSTACGNRAPGNIQAFVAHLDNRLLSVGSGANGSNNLGLAHVSNVQPLIVHRV